MRTTYEPRRRFSAALAWRWRPLDSSQAGDSGVKNMADASSVGKMASTKHSTGQDTSDPMT